MVVASWNVNKVSFWKDSGNRYLLGCSVVKIVAPENVCCIFCASLSFGMSL